MKRKSPLVAIIMGSQTDHAVMKKSEEVLQEFGIAFHTEIVSAHRTPEKMVSFAQTAADRGFKVIIAGAGGAAHLPGMVAALTTLPVIGVPISIGKLNGLDALLSIAQMPKGIPVATVAIENSANAAILAVRVLGAFDSKIEKKLLKFQDQQKKLVQKMNRQIKK